MNDRIRSLLNQMNALEDEMRAALQSQETKMFFEIRGRRIEFEKAVEQTHRKLKKNIFRWLVTNRPQNLITGPIIYGMIFPLLILDICVSLYQATCFPIYGVVKVRRRDYIAFDRQHLEWTRAERVSDARAQAFARRVRQQDAQRRGHGM